MYTNTTQLHINTTQLHINTTQLHINTTQLHINTTQLHINTTQPHINTTQLHTNTTQPHINIVTRYQQVTWKALACVWYLSSLYGCGLIGNYWIDNSKSKQEVRGKKIGDASDCPGGQFTRDECRKDEECGKIENQQGTRYNRKRRKSFASRGISRKTQRKRANNTIMNACDY